MGFPWLINGGDPNHSPTGMIFPVTSEKARPYFPLNPGCLVKDPYNAVFFIIPPSNWQGNPPLHTSKPPVQGFLNHRRHRFSSASKRSKRLSEAGGGTLNPLHFLGTKIGP